MSNKHYANRKCYISNCDCKDNEFYNATQAQFHASICDNTSILYFIENITREKIIIWEKKK
ncbi:MAG TPA: hypothetical protein VGB37_04540 [Candidatus Lokiarchaeia archaeon]